MDETAPTNSNPPLSLPDSWPGAFGIYKYSKQAVMLNLGTVVVMFGIAIGVALAVIIVSAVFRLPAGLRTIINDLLEVWVSAALTVVFLACARSTKITPPEALRQSQKFYLNFLLASIATVIIAALSFALFVIPFFFVFPRLALVNYFLIDRDMGPIDAIRASWRATKGYALRIWSITLLTAAMGALIIILIGIYFGLMYSAAMALLYIHITSRQSAAAVPADTTTPAV